MGKDTNSTFDFTTDPEFNENFYNNIELALEKSELEEKETKDKSNIEKQDDTFHTSGSAVNDNKTTLINQNNTQESDTESALEDKVEINNEKSVAKASGTVQEDKEISDEEIDEELLDINASLAKQICQEMDNCSKEDNPKHKKWFFNIQSKAVLSLLCIVGLGFFFGFTKPGNHLLMGMGVNITGTIWTTWTEDFKDSTDVIQDVDYLDEDDLSSAAPEIDTNTIVWPDHPGEGRQEEGVYNILLLGEEAIGSGSSRGRTDVIIIATMNTNTKEIKLTSLLRDTLVQIPAYKDNKLNTAYEKGGVDLMYETIALNFAIQLDGCVMVNFENFERIIDRLGGLELTLTSNEAKYLNSTNYISDPSNRDVVEGKQLMNGNQILGYARVRKRSTITGKNNDYGRTDRHRMILNAAFEKYKTSSKVDLASIMLSILPMIQTDIDSDCFELLLNSFIEMGTMEISQLRIPVDGAFEDNVKVRGMDVLIPDLDTNVEELHKFIFGENTVISMVQ